MHYNVRNRFYCKSRQSKIIPLISISRHIRECEEIPPCAMVWSFSWFHKSRWPHFYSIDSISRMRWVERGGERGRERQSEIVEVFSISSFTTLKFSPPKRVCKNSSTINTNSKIHPTKAIYMLKNNKIFLKLIIAIH